MKRILTLLLVAFCFSAMAQCEADHVVEAISFDAAGYAAYWWTPSADNTWSRALNELHEGIYRSEFLANESFGLSVRCIKDTE